jgi:hypothetical protein
MLPGGSMGHGYILQIFLLKNQKIVNDSTTTKAQEKINFYLKSLQF